MSGRLARALGSAGVRAILVAVLAGAAIGVVLTPRARTPADQVPAPEVLFLGSPLRLDEGTLEEALGRVRRFVTGSVALELPEGQRVELGLGRLGAEIDRARLAALVREARDPESPLRRVARERGATTLELPVPVDLAADRAAVELGALKDRIDRVPVEARLDLARRTVVPEVMGRLLDVDATLLELRAALGRGLRVAPARLELIAPRRRAADLGHVEFGAVLGWFETPYNRSEQYAARTFNLRLAASKLDGTVLLPGEVFDFNEVVGPRDEASGYKVAPVIAQGELVDGVGGGTCQVSGTLHGAAFFAGLAVVERYPHTRPSAYIKMGMDATVVYPTINFRLQNPFDFPVVLHQVVRNGVVRAEVLGPARTRSVTLIRKIDGVLPYEEVERPDPTLPEGLRVLAQRGVPGFKLHRYRIVRSGPHAVRERWADVYPPTTQIVRVGTGSMGREGVEPRHDPHPEYTADELLILTHGPEEGEGGARFTEQREAGRTGAPGWTAAEGMPVFRDAAGEAPSAPEGGSPARAAAEKPDRDRPSGGRTRPR